MRASTRQLVVLACTVLFFSSLPVIDVYRAAGTEWRGVPPVYTDEEYYYARMREIKDGYPFLGSPYFYEHRNDIAPTFFLTDWLAAIPFLAGLDLPATLVLNFFLWSVAFVFLAFFLLRELQLQKNLAALGALLLYLQSYLWVLRPVALQQVFPFFFLLLLAALRWYKAPESRKAKWFLAVAAAVTFYLYLYLAEVTVVASALLLFTLLLRKDWLRLRNLVFPFILGSVLALPALWYTAAQLTHPFYWQMAERISLVYTHLPTAEVVYSGGWVILTLLVFILLRRRIADIDRPAFLVLALFGVALVFVQASNLITGKEAETAVHVKRFIVPWLGISFAALVAWFSHGDAATLTRPLWRSVFYGALLALGAANLYFANMPDFATNTVQDARARALQTLSEPLAYLEQAESNPVVVWVTNPRSDAAYYLPVLTKHYLLYSHPGMWHLVGNDEVMERYLVANYFQGITKERLIADMSAYGGPAMAWHRANTVNRGVRLCRLLRLEIFGYACGKTITSEELLGEAYFDALLERSERDIRPNLRAYLMKYHVSYIVSPSPLPPAFEREIAAQRAYQDQNYVIYKLLTKENDPRLLGRKESKLHR